MIYRIDRTSIEDMIALKSRPLVDALLQRLVEVIHNGDTVVIERRYANAPADLIKQITTNQELVVEGQEWINAVNRLIEFDNN